MHTDSIYTVFECQNLRTHTKHQPDLRCHGNCSSLGWRRTPLETEEEKRATYSLTYECLHERVRWLGLKTLNLSLQGALLTSSHVNVPCCVRRSGVHAGRQKVQGYERRRRRNVFWSLAGCSTDLIKNITPSSLSSSFSKKASVQEKLRSWTRSVASFLTSNKPHDSYYYYFFFVFFLYEY